MGIIRGIIKTAKEAFEADSNDSLEEYFGEKISNFVNKIDGTEEEKILALYESKWEEIKEELNSDDFCNEYFQNLVDEYIEQFEFLDEQIMMAYYYKARGWENVLDANTEEMDLDEWKTMQEETSSEGLKNIDKALNILGTLDDEIIELWLCTLLCQKASFLHHMDKHTDAVRLAIQALPYACDNNEKEYAKSLISGKPNDTENFVIAYKGYGFEGRTIAKDIEYRTKICQWDLDEKENREVNEEYLDFYMEQFPIEIEEARNNKSKYRFSNRPYHDRQFIFMVRDLDHIGGCYDETNNIKYVFPLDELPGEITFPMGHPQANTLYYAHPLRPMYLPFENAQLSLFYEKIHEICRLFQCLGATEITTKCIKGKKISKEATSTQNTDIGGSLKLAKGNATFSNKGHFSENTASKNEMFLTQTFSPTQAPYCPEDLLWTLNDPELKTLIHQRLEGGLQEFSKRVSSFDTSNLSQNQITDVKAAFENLMLNVSANYSASSDSTFCSTEETEWEISVKFKPIDEFKNVQEQKPKEVPLLNEETFLMKITGFCPITDEGIFVSGVLDKDIATGDKIIISDGKHHMESEIEKIFQFLTFFLSGERGDKVALRLSGITAENASLDMQIYKKRIDSPSQVNNTEVKEKATEEAGTKKEMSKEEEFYKEEILFCLEDNGVITEEDRRYLERKRKKLNITEERAYEIEQQVIPSLTTEEQEYLETFKELCANGTISDRARRLLERERESLNISPQRALEIEKLATE